MNSLQASLVKKCSNEADESGIKHISLTNHHISYIFLGNGILENGMHYCDCETNDKEGKWQWNERRRKGSLDFPSQ